METDKLIRIVNELFVPQLLVFNLCFVYLGMLLAPAYAYSIRTAILLTIAFVAARSSGVLMNRYMGRAEDLSDEKKVRTMLSLKVPKRIVLLLFAVCAAIFILSAYLLNWLALLLVPIPLIFFVVDPIVKRHTSRRHYFLGLIESFDVMGGYIGAAAAFPSSDLVYLLMLTVIFIGGGFDIMISIRKAKFDKANELKTIASTKGVAAALNYSLYSHITASVLLIFFAIISGSYMVMVGSVVASIFLLAQHINVNPKDASGIMGRVAKYNTLAALSMLLSVLTAVLVL